MVKKQLLLLLSFLFVYAFASQAQVPQAISYQAVARTAAGNIMPNQNMGVVASILEVSPAGSVAYSEKHQVTTNQYGLFTIKLGLGSPITGTFSAINWSTGDQWLRIEVDVFNTGNFAILGTTQLLSVPYAFYAANAGTSSGGGGGVTGPTGPSGADGSQGPVGPTGPGGGGGGVTGPTGPSGTNGTNGATGAAGAAGANGITGPTGPTGTGGGSVGPGTQNYHAKFNNAAGTTIGTSLVFDNGTGVAIGSTTPGNDKLFVNTTNASAGSTAVHANSTVGGFTSDVYLGLNGTISADGFSLNNPALASVSSSNSNPSAILVTNGTNTATSVFVSSANWHGLIASASAATAYALIGQSKYLGDGGVYGRAANSGIGGLVGVGVDSTTAGVYGYWKGKTAAGKQAGVIGYCDSNAVGNGLIGVYGLYNSTSYYGIGVAGVGFNGAIPTTVPAGTGSALYDVGVLGTGGDYAVYSQGNFATTGTKSASVPTSKGNQLLYCVESPGLWFEDFGKSALANGETTIQLDALFLETVIIDQDHPMLVFVQPMGDNAMFVETGNASFKVKGAAGSSTGFMYRVMAKRKNYQDHRFGADVVQGGVDLRGQASYVKPIAISYEEEFANRKSAKANSKPKPNPMLRSIQTNEPRLVK